MKITKIFNKEKEYTHDEINKNNHRKEHKSNFVVSVLYHTIWFVFIVFICISVAIAGVIIGIGKAHLETTPDLDLNLITKQAKTSFIYDSNGKLLTDYKGIENRVMVGIDYIPKNLVNAFVAVEDVRFYKHNGIDIKRIVGAFVNNFVNGSTHGGSTITQQLIKNTVLTNEISYKRKIQEAYLALQLEKKYSKDQIMEAYLNTIYLGENYYGVKVAAKGYFNKELHELSIRECAMLAGLTSNPYYYNPQRNYYERTSDSKKYADITNNRTNYVLRQMYENNFISKQDYENALNESNASVVKKSNSNIVYKYAHYIEYAISDAIDVLLKKNNLEDNAQNRNKMENLIRTGGYHIKLAIDTDIQEILEDTLENWKNYPSTSDKKDSILRVKNADGTFDEIIQPQSSAVVIDYRTGEIKAIVGSRNRPTRLKTLNRAKDMNMPVGSAIKPLAVFAPAIDTGASPATIVYNFPIPIEGWLDDNMKYSFPKNYGGGSYTGFETFRDALRKSHNTSTASAFSMYTGIDKSVEYLKRLGVDDKNINKTPFGLALGSSGITPIQMSAAFGTFANSGIYQEPISILGISDSNGNVIYDAHKEQKIYQAVKPSTAWLIVDMLKDAIKNGTGSQANFSGQTVAGKTGTNSEHRGITFSGMTGYYVSSVWIGHDNYKPLSSKATGGLAGSLWKTYMQKIHEVKGLKNKDILAGSPEEYGLVKVSTCRVSGQLAGDECYHDANGYNVVTDWWPKDSVPQDYCQMHRSITICTASNKPASENCPQDTTVTMSGIFIPQGHPLYKFKGTIYQDIIRQYAGSSVIWDGDDYSEICDIHNYSNNNFTDNNSILNDAMSLINAANDIIQNYNISDEQKNIIIHAKNNLEIAIQSNDVGNIYNNMLFLNQEINNINTIIQGN